MSRGGFSIRDLTQIDRSAFSAFTGLRAGAFVSLPLLVAFLTGQTGLVYTTLGALFLTNTEGPLTLHVPLRVLLVACVSEAIAFWLGTVVGLSGLLAVPLVGLGVFVALLSALRPKWGPVGTYSAVVFAVGVGLPGGSVSVAGVRLVFSLLGGLWGLAGIGLHRFVTSRRRPAGVQAAGAAEQTQRARQLAALVRSEAFTHAVLVGVASSVGLAVGLALGLPRDFWIIVTIIFALRPSLLATETYTTMSVGGTLIGAAMAGLITLELSNDYILWLLMLAFAFALYATRGANFALTQVFVTPFIIILLNIVYPGHWQLAETRIIDVAIGGAISLLTSYVIVARWFRPRAAAVGPSGQTR